MTLFLSACSPTYNWRQTHGKSVPFTVLLPAKPTTVERPIDLNGIKVNMTMTAAEVEGITFAVGTFVLPDNQAAKPILEAMQQALLHNITGKSGIPAVPGKTDSGFIAIDMDIQGHRREQPIRLMARLMANDKHVYQIVVMGKEGSLTKEAIDTFFTSFKPY